MPVNVTSLPAGIVAQHKQMTACRRDLHRHPELAFKEHRTAQIVAAALDAYGCEVFTGIGKTGVVGRLQNGNSSRAIGLRADMDALPMQECNEFAHQSAHPGVMHGCGHDGHTTMLLGAAKHLAQTRQFDGTVYFIFQPAEEGEGGAPAMIEDGLFERFVMDEVYALHNMPGIPAGQFSITSGPMMAAFAKFDILIHGVGGHGAMPHYCVDPVVIGSQLVQALQGIISRNIDPSQAGVLSVTRFHAGDPQSNNVIPQTARLGGCTRYLQAATGALIEQRMREIVHGFAVTHAVEIDLEYQTVYPVLSNAAQQTAVALRCATALVGPENVNAAQPPIMASEDFAYMLQETPGAFIFIGNGDGEGGCMVHHPNYDFNDEILPLGASYFSRLVESQLAPSGT